MQLSSMERSMTESICLEHPSLQNGIAFGFFSFVNS